MTRNEDGHTSGLRLVVNDLLGILVLMLIVGGWWHGSTALQRMPVGGDAGTFFLPLMSSYQEALRGQTSLQWNHRWGFGFPQLAESQTGAMYPLHLLLYRFLPVEVAFSANQFVHLLIAALGAFVCARVVGLGASGAVVTGLVYSGSGFFVLHLAHQWAYTAGAWLPWVLACTCRILDPRGPGRLSLALAVVGLPVALMFQLLAGHFQVAFYTVLAMVLFGLLWCRSVRVLVLLAAGMAVGFALAGAQLLPTARLALFAGGPGTGTDYAREFAVPPVHLVLGSLLPGAFHVIPAWRPLAWDAYRTSPEEVLTFFGWTPLVLLVLGLTSKKPEVGRRAGAALAVAGVVLAMLPFIPGLRWLTIMPGFSWFRASARATVLVGLGVGLLAGVGLSVARDVLRRHRADRYTHFVLLAGLLAASGIVLGMAGGSGEYTRAHLRSGWLRLAGIFCPWPVRVEEFLREGSPYPSAPLDRFAHAAGGAEELEQLRRTAAQVVRVGDVIRYELVPWVCLFVVSMFAYYGVGRRKGTRTAVLIGLTAVELWAAGLLSPVFFHDRQPVRENSAVLSTLGMDRTALNRTVGLVGNTALLGGASPVPGYRTLDLPVRWPLAGTSPERSLELIGARFVVEEVPRRAVAELVSGQDEGRVSVLDDPLLEVVMYGRVDPTRVFVVRRVSDDEAILWFVESTHESEDRPPEDWSGRAFVPVRMQLDGDGLQVTAAFTARRAGWLIWTAPYYPAWRGSGTRGGSEERSLQLMATSDGWCAVRIPEAGDWQVNLHYRDIALTWGWLLSATGLVGWLALCVTVAVLSRTHGAR